MSADTMIPDAYHSQSYNRYTYVENGPLSYEDPTGNVGFRLTGPTMGFSVETLTITMGDARFSITVVSDAADGLVWVNATQSGITGGTGSAPAGLNNSSNVATTPATQSQASAPDSNSAPLSNSPAEVAARKTVSDQKTQGNQLNTDPGQRRNLTPGEVAMDDQVFHGALNTSIMRVEWTHDFEDFNFDAAAETLVKQRDAGPNSALVDVLDFAPTTYRPDFSQIHSMDDFMSAFYFIHESTHAWQDQTGVPVGTDEAQLQVQFSGHRSDAYKFNLNKDTKWTDLNIEQQADLVAFTWARAFGSSKYSKNLDYPGSLSQMESTIPFFGGR
jgi:hypothetical protein